jgi:hypothetical protein
MVVGSNGVHQAANCPAMPCAAHATHEPVSGHLGSEPWAPAQVAQAGYIGGNWDSSYVQGGGDALVL